jgi:hypothetical protein
MKSTIEMVQESGLYETLQNGMPGAAQWVGLVEELEHLVELVRADERSIEREACAKVCEDLDWSQDSTWEVATLDCAEAIRARGETK